MVNPNDRGLNQFRRDGVIPSNQNFGVFDFIRNGNSLPPPVPAGGGGGKPPLDTLTRVVQEKEIADRLMDNRMIKFIAQSGKMLLIGIVLPGKLLIVVVPKWIFATVLPEMAFFLRKVGSHAGELFLKLAQHMASLVIRREIISNYFKVMQQIISSIFTNLGDIGKNLLKKALKPPQDAAVWVGRQAKVVSELIKKAANAMTDVVKANFEKVQNALQKVLEPVVKWAAPHLKSMAEATQTRLINAAEYVQQGLNWLQNKASQSLRSVAKVSEAAAETAKRYGTKIAKPFAQLSKLQAPDFAQIAVKPLEFITKTLYPKVVRVSEMAVSQAQKMVNFIKQQPIAAYNFAQQQMKQVSHFVKGMSMSPLAWIKGKVEAVINFGRKIQNFAGIFGRAFARLKREALIFIKKLADKGLDLFSGLKKKFEPLKEKIKKAPAYIKEQVLSIHKLFVSFFRKLANLFIRLGQFIGLSFRLGGHLFRELYREVQKWTSLTLSSQ